MMRIWLLLTHRFRVVGRALLSRADDNDTHILCGHILSAHV